MITLQLILVDFSAWLQERDVEPIGDCDPWAWLDGLVDDYEEELENERTGID